MEAERERRRIERSEEDRSMIPGTAEYQEKWERLGQMRLPLMEDPNDVK